MYLARRMTLDDVEQVHSIEQNTFSTPWSKESLEKELTSNTQAIYMVLEEKNEILAYSGLWNIVSEGHITNIAVKKDKRGLGLGEKVTKAILNEGNKLGIKSFTLEVRKSNIVAIRLYTKLGFTVAGIRKNFYDSPKEDAYIMWKLD
ncbi:MAG: ribosomal protein S18-alanine N-acetyltransferase [Vallitalea sp.]|jgi:ribosomal-protein-alanine N-acetyltransferase|nr:ribosomal protein S18-alanine N-acetyltransferase [Vallitalea sp.]